MRSLRDKIVIGTHSLSGDLGPVSLTGIQETLTSCADAGFTEFDVSPDYGGGFAEICLGLVFGDDAAITINSKCGNHPFKVKDYGISSLRRSLDQTLKRLRRTRIDTLFLHNPRDEIDDYQGVADFMAAAKDAGLIRLSGLSKARRYAYTEADLQLFDCVQDDINLLYQAPLLGPPSKQTLFARSPLASGVLSGTLTGDSRFGKDDQRSGWLTGARLASLCRRADVLRHLSPLPLARLARRFVLQHPGVDKVIFGVRTPAHVADIVDDIDAPPLEGALLEDIAKAYEDDFGLVGQRDLGF